MYDSKVIYSVFHDEVLIDGKDFIDSNFQNGEYDNDTEFDEVYDDMFISDEVCNNGIISLNNVDDEDLVSNAVFCDWFKDATEDFCLDGKNFIGLGKKGLFFVNASIRCYMLNENYGDLEDYFNKVKRYYHDKG